MGIEAKNIVQRFGEPPTEVLHGLSLEIKAGEFITITGKSGSGKSTLLYILSTLDPPAEGSVVIDGRDIQKMDSHELHRFRNEHMGFVFQFHYLLPELTAIENVLMPAIKLKQEKDRRGYALSLLGEFGLGGKEHRFPSQLSGGEQQRVALARALLMNPRYVFADEPTGNLDSYNGEVVMRIFRRLNQENKAAIIYVTHDPDFAGYADRQVLLVDGSLA